MDHLQLLLLVAGSYGLSLWGLERWRRFRDQPPELSLHELAVPHLRAALAPLADSLGQEVTAALADRIARGEGPAALAELAHAPLGAERCALLDAAVAVTEAGHERSSLRRHQKAIRGRDAARSARSLGAPAIYLESIALLAFLCDAFTEDLRLWQTRRSLVRAAEKDPANSLLQLGVALRCAVAGRPADAVAALARALYHAPGDRFIAERVLAVPLVEEVSPGLLAEARRELEQLRG